MLRRILWALGLLLLGGVAFVGWRVHRYFRTETVRVDDRLSVVLGGGGNTVVLACDDGALVVDTKFVWTGRRLADEVRTLTDKPVKTIINTHYHADHTHGNVNYPVGTTVVAQRRTRRHLVERDSSFWEFGPAWELLPKALVDDQAEIHCGDETVRIIHPGAGHTDGDVVVLFVNRGLLVTGDLFLHDQYPFIDRKGGGSGVAWPDTLDRVLAIDGVRTYVPGHGALAKREDVLRFQRYLRSLVAQVRDGVARHASLDAIRAGIDLRAFGDFTGIPFLKSPRENVGAVYEELTAAPPAAAPKGE